VIVTDASAILLDRPSTAVGWASFARRGMLWSEVQVFDVMTVPPHAQVDVMGPDYLEVLFCADGSLLVEGGNRGAGLRLLSGQCAVYRPGEARPVCTAGSSGAAIVRLRVLVPAVSARLGPRHPVSDDGNGRFVRSW
jgi:hypothetical protein